MISQQANVQRAELNYEYMFPLKSDSNYEPLPGESFGARTSESNQSPAGALYDHLVKDSAIVVELLLVAIKVGAQQRVVLGPLGDDGLEVRDVLLVE